MTNPNKNGRNEFVLDDGTSVCIRPITLDDMDREKAFVEQLSPQTKHERFLGGISGLTDTQLKYFCDVDFDLHVAYIATIKHVSGENQIGVARYVQDETDNTAEIAITVADAWQHQGLGSLLMKHLISHAYKKGIDLLYSYELASNKNMLMLAKKFGFLVQRDPDNATQVLCTLSLDQQHEHQDLVTAVTLSASV